MSDADKSFQAIGQGMIAAPAEAERKELSDRLGKMIDYAIKRHDWYDDQRNKALSLALGLLGLSSFLASGLLAQPVEKLYLFRVFATLTLLAILGTAIWMILEYMWGSRLTYTHRKLADIRSWYFAYTVKTPGKDPAIFDVSHDAQNQETLKANWEDFVTRWNEYKVTKNAFVVEDLQQVFILFLLQNIKRSSLRDMLKPAYVGGLIVALCLAATILSAGFRV